MKPNTNLESFGTVAFYKPVIDIVQNNKHHWRKIARMLQKIRRQLHPWPMVDREIQRQVAHVSIIQALKDTKLPDEVKAALKYGMSLEFRFEL